MPEIVHNVNKQYTIVNHKWEELPDNEVDFSAYVGGPKNPQKQRTIDWSIIHTNNKYYLRYLDGDNTEHYYECPFWVGQLFEAGKELGKKELRRDIRKLLNM